MKSLIRLIYGTLFLAIFTVLGLVSANLGFGFTQLPGVVFGGILAGWWYWTSTRAKH